MPSNHGNNARRKAGPILFLLVLFITVAVPVHAAYITWPPYSRTNETLTYNGTLDTAPCCFEKYSYCLDTDTKATDGSTEVDQYVSDGVWQLTNFTSHTVVQCNNGCSSTLNDCRPDVFNQFLYIIGLLVAAGVIGWFSPKLGSAGIVVGALSLLLAIYLATSWDVFSGTLSWFLPMLPFVIIGSFAFQWAFGSGENEE